MGKVRTLPASLKLREGRPAISVDTRGAVYPLTVDPLFGAETKITGSNATADDEFGCSVWIDGNSAVVGAPFDDLTAGNAGLTYIFALSGTTWPEQWRMGENSATTSFNYLGYSVSISGDTAVMGAPNDDGAGAASGSIQVFIRSGVNWAGQAKLTAADAAAGDNFGSKIALDGDTTIIGAWGDDDNGADSGSVYVFVRSGTTWTQQSKLIGTGIAAGHQFGSTSIAIDGDTVIVNAHKTTEGGAAEAGSAYVFTRTGTFWTQQQELVSGTPTASDHFGFGVAVSGDTAIVGCPQDDDNAADSGSAYIYTRSGTTWTLQQKITAGDPQAGDRFGHSVAIDGDTAVVSANADDDGGTSAVSTKGVAFFIGF